MALAEQYAMNSPQMRQDHTRDYSTTRGVREIDSWPIIHITYKKRNALIFIYKSTLAIRKGCMKLFIEHFTMCKI